MKRLSLVLVLMLLLVAIFCSTGSAFRKKRPKAPVVHECVFVYDVDGDEQTFTSYAEECPEGEDWWDNGPTRDADANGRGTGLTPQEKNYETSDLHECVFVYDIDGEERTLTVYAEECPEDGVWQDNGPTRSAVADESTSSSTRLTTATTTLTDHKCVYTYYVLGDKYTYTACAPVCPDHPDWRDLGIPCP